MIAAAFLAVVVALVAAPAGAAAPRGDIDGRIAFDRDGDIWAIDAPGSVPDTTPAPITSGPDADAKPSWSPPVRFWESRPTLIAFQRTDSDTGNTDIYTLDVDGAGTPEPDRLTQADGPDTAPAWAPFALPGTPGSNVDPPPYPPIAFERLVGGNRDILVMNADGSGQVNVTNTPGIDESNPDWAPVSWRGESHLAFDTAERGIREVFVMPIAFDATAGFVAGARRPVTTQQPPSSDPSWFAFTPPGEGGAVSDLTDQIAFSGPEEPGGAAQINIAEYVRADPAVDPDVFSSTSPFSQPARIVTDVITSGVTPSTAPAWAPTGVRVAYVRDGEIYVLDPAADADVATNVTQSDAREDRPDWEAVRVRDDATFPRRPRGRRSRRRPARQSSVTTEPSVVTTEPTPATQRPSAPSGHCTKTGTRRADHLRGTRRRDVICGRAGNDVILGLRGNDVLRGGAGRDRLLGGRGKDRLYGDAGNDRLFGGPGRDRIAGGPGRDRLPGPRGRDRLISVQHRPRA